VTPILVLVAVLVVACGVTAAAAQDPRLATLGAFGAVTLAALVSDPLPSAAALLARLAGALLGGWLVWMSLRGAPRVSARTALGWPGTAGVAAAAFAGGWLAASHLGVTVVNSVGDAQAAGVPGGSLAGGSAVALAAISAAAALAVLAAAPVVLPRDGLRLGLGVILLVAAAGLLGDGAGAGPDDTLDLAVAILIALTGAAIAGVTTAMLRTGGDLVLRDALAREPAVRHRAADDAHRGDAR
jgi:hypothetical protein